MNEESISLHQSIDSLALRLPPSEIFITLSQAVSWIAFRHSIEGSALSALIGIGKLRTLAEADRDTRLDDAITSAMKRLTDLGSGGIIEIRGRYYRDVLDDEIRIFTRRIPTVRLADYRWFDTLDDSLFRGLGLAWGQDRRELHYPPRDEGHYRFVTVKCADLMREFPADPAEPLEGHDVGSAVDGEPLASRRAPAVKCGRPPDDEAILAMADEMKKRGLSGYNIAKKMHLEQGFENTATTHVRELIKGRYKRGRPKISGQ
jgi:hypothetical protein